MKKKVALVGLALAFCVSGAAVATACNNGQQQQKVQHTVNFVMEDGVTQLGSAPVWTGDKVEAIRVEEKAGYSIVWKDASGNVYDFNSEVTSDLTLILTYVAATDIVYKVEYYTQNLENGAYALSTTDTLQGGTDSSVTAPEKAIEGFTFDASNSLNRLSGTVKGDGSLVLRRYYTRNTYRVTYEADGVEVAKLSFKYGEAFAKPADPEPANKTELTMDEFRYWSATEGGAEFDFTATPAQKEFTLYAVYETVERKYDVNFVFDTEVFNFVGEDGSYLSQEKIVAGNSLSFSIEESDEAEGAPTVIATKGGVATTLTATAGKYTISNITGDYTVSVEGLVAKTYTVLIDVIDTISGVDYPADSAWARPYADVSEVIARVTKYTASGTKVTEQTSVIADGRATLLLPKGDYDIEFVVADGEGYKAVGDKTIAVTVDGATQAEDTVTLGETKLTITKPENFPITNGVIIPTVVNKDGGHLNAVFTDFVPGDDDFIATFTVEENGTWTESDAMTGIRLYGTSGNPVWVALNATGLRMRDVFSAHKDLRGIFSTPNMLSKENGYDKVTYTLVRKGDAIYVIMSGSISDGSLAATEGRLMAVLTADAIAVTGSYGVLTQADGYGTNVANVLANGVTKVDFALQMTNDAPTKIYAYGYSTDADVVADYLEKYASAYTVSVGGEQSDPQETLPGFTVEKEIEVPAGHVVTGVTVNGEAINFANKVDGETVYAVFTIPVGFDGGDYDVVIAHQEGELARLNGKVNTDAEDYTVTVDGVEIEVDGNGNFSANVVAGGSYVVKVASSAYKTNIVTVTDLSESLVIEHNVAWTTANVVTVGSKTYTVSGSHASDIKVGDADVDKMVRGTDENGNEIVKQVQGTTAQRQIQFYNYVGSKFVAEATIQYHNVSDAYPRIGFTVIDEAGNLGYMAMYGMQTSSIIASGWPNYNLTTGTTGTNFNGDANKIMAAPISVKLVYDNGYVQFYVKNVTMLKDENWHLFYQGEIYNKGTLPKGDVAIGFAETHVNSPDCTWSNLKIAGFTDMSETCDDYTVEDKAATHGTITVTPTNYGEGGKEIDNITLDGQSVNYEFNAETGAWVITVPANYDVVADHALEVTMVDFVAKNHYSGKVVIGDNDEKATNTLLEFTNAENVTLSVTTDANGEWSLWLPAGEYTLTVTNGEAKNAYSKEITLDDETVLETIDLGEKHDYVAVTDGGLIYDTTDQSLNRNVNNGNTTETAIRDVTFTPDNEILVLKYTLSNIGVPADAYNGYFPHIGMFVKDSNGGMVRIAQSEWDFTRITFMTNNDYGARYVFDNTATYGENAGIGKLYNWTGPKDYKNITFDYKVTIDGNKATFAFKVSNAQGYNSQLQNEIAAHTDEEGYVKFFETLDVKELYQSNKADYVNTLYDSSLPCQFGISCRVDSNDNTKNGFLAKFTNISYTITPRA